jgi:hypothetical protein
MQLAEPAEPRSMTTYHWPLEHLAENRVNSSGEARHRCASRSPRGPAVIGWASGMLAELPPRAAASSADPAREETDQPDESDHGGDDEQPMDGEADTERDDREYRESNE